MLEQNGIAFALIGDQRLVRLGLDPTAVDLEQLAVQQVEP